MHQGVRSIRYSLDLELQQQTRQERAVGGLVCALADLSPFATMCILRNNRVLCAVVSNLLCFLLMGTRLVLQHFPLWLVVSLPLTSLPEPPTPHSRQDPSTTFL